jgi:hypothetical protein
MNVIGFLCVSLGSSTVQLHDSLGSRCAYACSEAGFSSQNCDRTCYAILCAKDIHKEMFLVYDGKCLLLKVVHSWMANILLLRQMLKQVWKWLRQQSEDSDAAGFNTLVQWWDKWISVGGGFVKKYIFLIEVQVSCVLQFISICDLFTDSLIYMNV